MSMNAPLVKPSIALRGSASTETRHLFLFEAAEETVKTLTYHSLALGDIHLLIPEGVLGEVVDELEVCPLPKAGKALLGMCSLRGNIVPIFDIYQLLGVAAPEKLKRVIVLGSGRERVGFMINHLPQKVKFTDEERSVRLPPLPERLSPFVETCFQRQGVWLQWDIFGFFRAAGKQI